MLLTRLTVGSALAAGAFGLSAAPAFSNTCWLTRAGREAVELCDVSSRERTPTGFSIAEVVAPDRILPLSGRVAFRTSRESYDCATGSYGVSGLKEYDRAGALLDASGPTDAAAYGAVAGAPSDKVLQRFCRSGPAAARNAMVAQTTPFSGCRYGHRILEAIRSPDA